MGPEDPRHPGDRVDVERPLRDRDERLEQAVERADADVRERVPAERHEDARHEVGSRGEQSEARPERRVRALDHPSERGPERDREERAAAGVERRAPRRRGKLSAQEDLAVVVQRERVSDRLAGEVVAAEARHDEERERAEDEVADDGGDAGEDERLDPETRTGEADERPRPRR